MGLVALSLRVFSEFIDLLLCNIASYWFVVSLDFVLVCFD